MRDPECADTAECLREPACAARKQAPANLPIPKEWVSYLAAPDTKWCWVCGVPAVLFLFDDNTQWFTCITHHGTIAVRLLRGDLLGAPT
ncbi:hypothetical protein [Streptomyces sp. NPDC088725]|uniref:hypothetical protein n=1 Tax=Streptomyces sp. NPDC088725 TaxID=3365873 RepID=UPI00381A3289